MDLTEFDAYLDKAGGYGPAQLQIFLLSTFIGSYSTWQSYSPVFTARFVDFVCLDNITSSLNSGFQPDNGSTFINKCLDNCAHYEYDSKQPSSIVRDFDLACGSGPYLVSLANSAYWVGYFLSCILAGSLSDKFGRKWVSFGLLIGLLVSTTANAFARNIYLYIVLRALCGFFVVTFAVDFITLSETVTKSRFSLVGCSSLLFYTFGELFCILFAYLLQGSWRLQILAMAVPVYLYVVPHIFLMPESPRWLFSQGKYKQAEKVLRRIAKLNKLALFDDIDADRERLLQPNTSVTTAEFARQNTGDFLLRPQKSEQESASIEYLFTTKHTTSVTITCALSWFACCLINYGLLYDTGSFAGDIYINAILLTTIEFPAWFAFYALDYFGRKRTLSVSLFISSVACVALPFTGPLRGGKLQIVFAFLSRLLGNVAFNIVYIYTPEFFPTVLRTTGWTFCSAIARIASISAPFIIEINIGHYKCLPFLIFAAVGLTSSISVLLFAFETKGKPFLTTVEEFQEACKKKQVQVS
ncbi:solute carrier family 22 member 15-like isoform X2 [Convolutriloba macropyga]|uniref:solute carrier family 22 member 15-like isoform X2 n=1 Tax=Convolutriloba macropyga TaxID=536237 RepID=UPI003F521971